jgi:hypothetical protein
VPRRQNYQLVSGQLSAFVCYTKHLSRIENVLDTMQVGEERGFRQGYRLEEHLVSANVVIDRFLAVGVPVCGWLVLICRKHLTG